MAIVVREKFGSRRIETVNGSSRGYRSFFVYNDSAPITSPDTVYALTGTNGLPDFGDPFPGALLEVADIRVEPLPDTEDHWLVTFDHTDAAVGLGGNQIQPLDPGYVDISANGIVELRDIYRSLTSSQMAALVASGGTNPYGAGDVTTDIVGTPVDTAGEPVSKVARLARVSVTVVTDTFPVLGYLSAFTGRRNNATFWGAGQGSVLYENYSLSRAALQRWRVTHNFLIDDAYHMRQVARRGADGSPLVVTSFADGLVHAYKVVHVQPYPDYANFYAIDSHFTGKL